MNQRNQDRLFSLARAVECKADLDPSYAEASAAAKTLLRALYDGAGVDAHAAAALQAACRKTKWAQGDADFRASIEAAGVWDESKHPRDAGKFSSKPGAGAAPKDGPRGPQQHGGSTPRDLDNLETPLGSWMDGLQEMGHKPDEVLEGAAQALASGIDPTVSDDLASLGEYMGAMIEEGDIDEPDPAAVEEWKSKIAEHLKGGAKGGQSLPRAVLDKVAARYGSADHLKVGGAARAPLGGDDAIVDVQIVGFSENHPGLVRVKSPGGTEEEIPAQMIQPSKAR